ncbi:MAG: glycogen synthase [Clostridia bacterium]|nr:glycogen synthase [Clostridia bacterium]
MKHIVYVTGEAAPFAVSGGLGDVMGALPRAVRRLRGRETAVSVILPLYGSVATEWRGRMRRVFSGEFSLAWRRVSFAVHRLSLSGVEYLFVEHPRYFAREAMYGEFDDGERFAFFGRAVLEYLLGTDRIPDILHANDWQTALLIVYLRTLYAHDPRARRIRTVLTVHNIEYQGRFSPDILSDIFDLPPHHLGILEYDGALNLLKGGMVMADRVTTVSPRYAEELHDPAFAFGLAPIVASLTPRIVGITNGVDTACFDPGDERALPRAYGRRDAEEGKAASKAAVGEELRLPTRGSPLLLMVTRLTESKGIPLVLAALPALLSLDIRLVVLGTGEERYEAALREVEEKYPDKVRVLLRFDRDMSRKLYAAADIFLMPSRTEPCGIAQMIACRYGTVPVVHATGGLADTVIPYGRPGGCGFWFSSYRKEALFDAVGDAVALYRAGDGRFAALRTSCMSADFSWRRAAARYLSLYSELLEGQ